MKSKFLCECRIVALREANQAIARGHQLEGGATPKMADLIGPQQQQLGTYLKFYNGYNSTTGFPIGFACKRQTFKHHKCHCCVFLSCINGQLRFWFSSTNVFHALCISSVCSVCTTQREAPPLSCCYIHPLCVFTLCVSAILWFSAAVCVANIHTIYWMLPVSVCRWKFC